MSILLVWGARLCYHVRRLVLRVIISKDSAQLEAFPNCIHLQRIDSTCNMRRFYQMTIQMDLFGDVSLIRVWGRTGTRGRQQVNSHADEGRAINALLKLAQEKRRRGYER